MNDIPVSSGDGGDDGVTTSSMKLQSSSLTLPPLPPLSTSLPPPSLPSRSSSFPPSPQVWLTIQDFSMFLNTTPIQSHETHDNAITRTFFTLCSLNEYISQFNRTDPDAKDNAETDEEYFKYQDLHSRFPSAIHTVTMMLYFLYKSPQFYLPLAPFRSAISSVIDLTNTFWWAHRGEMYSFDTICNYVTGILSMRIQHAVVVHLYPHLNLYRGESAPQLEHDRPPLLEWLARDTLAAFNPIEIMLMYYRPIITEFNQIVDPTPEDRQLSFKKVKWIIKWLHDMHPICMMYGLHIHDSLWVPIDAWTELAGYMNTIATEMAPDLFDVVQGKHPDPASDEERHEISSTKSLHKAFLYCIATCFTHHYRPMGKPYRYTTMSDSGTVQCEFSSTTYLEMVVNLPTALEQYATMYAEDPTQFECEGSQSAHDTYDNNPHVITPSSIRPAFDDIIYKTRPLFEKEYYSDSTYCHRLSLELPSYKPSYRQLPYLICAILQCPPVDDPVYTLFASWFTHAPDDMRIVIPDPYTVPEDPEFTY